jgi:hypothetical protein
VGLARSPSSFRSKLPASQEFNGPMGFLKITMRGSFSTTMPASHQSPPKTTASRGCIASRSFVSIHACPGCAVNRPLALAPGMPLDPSNRHRDGGSSLARGIELQSQSPRTASSSLARARVDSYEGEATDMPRSMRDIAVGPASRFHSAPPSSATASAGCRSTPAQALRAWPGRAATRTRGLHPSSRSSLSAQQPT